MRIRNVVVSAKLDRELNLEAVATSFMENTEHHSTASQILVHKLKRPRSLLFKFKDTITLLYRNGKIICVRANSMKKAKKSVLKVAELLRRKGITVKNPKIKIENIVASADLGSQIDLEGLYKKAGVTASTLIYEPEQFSAAIFRMEDPRVVFLIFPNGKTVCVGAKKIEEARKAFKKLKRLLKENNACTTVGFNGSNI